MSVTEAGPNSIDVNALVYDPNKFAIVEQNHVVINRFILSWVGVTGRYKVRYKALADNWVSLPETNSPTVSIDGLKPDVYQFVVVQLSIISRESQPASITYTILGEDSPPPPVPNVTGLRLDGDTGTTFTGRNPKFIWDRSVNADGDSIYFRDYEVRIYDADGTTLQHTDHVVDPTFTYPFELNFQNHDGVPTRSIVIKVWQRGRRDQLSPDPAILAVSNPQPALPNGFETSAHFRAVIAEYITPNITDFEGILIWMSTDPGFVQVGDQPGVGNCVYRGKDTLIQIPAEPGTEYYLRYAAFDSFGTTGLTVSGTIAQDTPQINAVDLAQQSVLQSHLFATLGERIDLIDASAGVSGSVNQRIDAAIGGVGTGNEVFHQASEPVSSNIGDLWFDSDDGNKVYYWDGADWLATDDARISSTITSLSGLTTTVNGHTAALIEESEVRAAADGSLEAQWVVKIDLNGYISGIGLAATNPTDGDPFSEFLIRADRFAVGGTGTTNIVPFIVSGGETFIDTVHIKTASILNAMILSLNADKIVATSLDAISANVGTLVVSSGGYIRSGMTAYAVGTGWYIGNDAGVPKLSIGTADHYLRWNGTDLIVRGRAIDTRPYASGPICIANAQAVVNASSSLVSLPAQAGYILLKEIRIVRDGVLNVKFDMISHDPSGGGAVSVSARIYKNGSAVGTVRTLSGSNSWTTYSEDISVASGDDLQLYGTLGGAGTGGWRRFGLWNAFRITEVVTANVVEDVNVTPGSGGPGDGDGDGDGE
jgi:hypothetical protein